MSVSGEHVASCTHNYIVTFFSFPSFSIFHSPFLSLPSSYLTLPYLASIHSSLFLSLHLLRESFPSSRSHFLLFTPLFLVYHYTPLPPSTPALPNTLLYLVSLSLLYLIIQPIPILFLSLFSPSFTHPHLLFLFPNTHVLSFFLVCLCVPSYIPPHHNLTFLPLACLTISAPPV